MNWTVVARLLVLDSCRADAYNADRERQFELMAEMRQ